MGAYRGSQRNEKNHTLNDIRTRALGRSKYSFWWPRVSNGNCNRPQRVRDRTCPSIRDCHHTQSAIGSIRQVSFSDCLNHSCFELLFTLWVATLTYSLANIHSRPSLLNWHVVWVYFKTYILSRSNQTKFLNKPSKVYTYPQIRNVFVTGFSIFFIASCPRARRVGFTPSYLTIMYRPLLRDIQGSCPHLEVLEDFGGVFWTENACNRA